MKSPNQAFTFSPYILFAGIGNLLRKDDGAGVVLCKQLIPTSRKRVILAEVSIENYLGKINRMAPQTLILVDSVDFGKEPGYWACLPVEELKDISFHTHHLSLKTVSLLFDAKVMILGIQPRSREIGEGLSPEVQASVDTLASLINASEKPEALFCPLSTPNMEIL